MIAFTCRGFPRRFAVACITRAKQTRDRLDGVAKRAPLTGVCTGRVAADVCRVREDLGTTHDRVPRFVPRPNGRSNGGGTKVCRASFERGKLLCSASRSQGENRPLSFSPSISNPTFHEGYRGIRKRARHQGGGKWRSEGTIFVGTLVALSWSHAVLPSPMSVQDFAKSGTIEPFDYILTFVALLSEYIPVTMKLKKIEIYRKKLARSIISQNCFSRYIFLEFAIVLVTYQLIEEGGWLRGCDYDRTFSRGNRARHALAWLSVRWPSIIV